MPGGFDCIYSTRCICIKHTPLWHIKESMTSIFQIQVPAMCNWAQWWKSYHDSAPLYVLHFFLYRTSQTAYIVDTWYSIWITPIIIDVGSWLRLFSYLATPFILLPIIFTGFHSNNHRERVDHFLEYTAHLIFLSFMHLLPWLCYPLYNVSISCIVRKTKKYFYVK